MIVEQRIFKSVAALSVSNTDYIVPNGQTLDISEMAGSALGSLADTLVQIIWDPAGVNKIILSTNEETGAERTTDEFVGDGIKVMRIMLTNNDIQSRTFGAYFLGEVN